MNRILCIAISFFAIFSFLSLELGSTFSAVSILSLIAIIVILLVLFLITQKVFLQNLITFSFFALLSLLFVFYIYLPQLNEANSLNEQYVTSEGKITSSRKSGDDLILTVKCNELDDTEFSHNISLVLRNCDSPEFDVGKRVKFSGKLSFSDSSYNKGNTTFLSAFPSYYEVSDKTDPIGEFTFIIRSRIKSITDRMDNSGLLKAMIIGDRSGIDEELQKDLKKLGTSHLLAISGLHLSIIVMSFYAILTRHYIPHYISAIFAIALAFVYLLITGFSFSLLRASQMLFIYFLSRIFLSFSDAVTSLFIGGFVILLISPWSIFNISFLLSFFATLGIIIFSRKLSDQIRKIFADNEEEGFKYNKRQKKLINLLVDFIGMISTTISATIFTLPIILLTFNEISLFSVLGNLLTIFFAKYFLTFSFISVILQIFNLSILSLPFTFLSNELGRLFLFLTRYISSKLPDTIHLSTSYISIAIIIVVVTIFIFSALSRKIWSLPALAVTLTVLMVLYNTIAISASANIAFIDIANGYGSNATLVRWKNKVYLLDQTASNSKSLYEIPDIAEKNGIEKIDKIVFTSLNEVPLERLKAISEQFKIESVTLVTYEPDIDDVYLLREYCSTSDIELKISYNTQVEVVDGIKAICLDELCTAFIIENGDNSFCTYRSFSEYEYFNEAIQADTIVFAGEECIIPKEISKDTSFRLNKE